MTEMRGRILGTVRVLINRCRIRRGVGDTLSPTSSATSSSEDREEVMLARQQAYGFMIAPLLAFIQSRVEPGDALDALGLLLSMLPAPGLDDTVRDLSSLAKTCCSPTPLFPVSLQLCVATCLCLLRRGQPAVALVPQSPPRAPRLWTPLTPSSPPTHPTSPILPLWGTWPVWGTARRCGPCCPGTASPCSSAPCTSSPGMSSCRTVRAWCRRGCHCVAPPRSASCSAVGMVCCCSGRWRRLMYVPRRAEGTVIGAAGLLLVFAHVALR